MTEIVNGDAVVGALQRACAVLVEQADYFTSLDQALGDGDMGINLAKIGAALQIYAAETPIDDIGQYLAKAGMTGNRAGPSTMGTLVATALMRAGKEVKGKTELNAQDLAAMFKAADQGMQDRGKAKPGNKTIIDAIHPAAAAFDAAITGDASLADAAQQAVDAAAAGRDAVTPLRSQVGRAGWIGERTEGKLDPGCVMFVMVLESIIGE